MDKLKAASVEAVFKKIHEEITKNPDRLKKPERKVAPKRDK